MSNDAQRLDRIEVLAERTAANLDRLTEVTGTRASSIAAHDDQIEQLLKLAEEHHKVIANLERQWQAYLTTIHPRQ